MHECVDSSMSIFCAVSFCSVSKKAIAYILVV